MEALQLPAGTAELFSHVSAAKAALYRAILDVFAGAKRQYRLQLRPDEVLAEAAWPGPAPSAEELASALAQLVAWGNLEAQPDIARVSTLADYYRARFLYRLSQGGEAVEAGLGTYARLLARRAELQTVALEDISHRLQALTALLDAGSTDVPKLHETLRDLVRVFEGLADNAQAFMAGVARSLELQRADEAAVAAYKKRLIDYLERFVGDLVQRSETIARLVAGLGPRIDPVLLWLAEREARDAAPGSDAERADEEGRRFRAWRERWAGLRGWFLPGGASGHELPQAELLRARARAAIPQLLAAVAAVNERRSGRSDRSADFRALAHWFAACADDDEAHRMARAAFALNPARHLALNPASGSAMGAGTPWAEAPPIAVHPRLREQGLATARGAPPRVRLRDAERAQLAALLQEESRQVDAARRLLAQGRPLQLSRLSETGPLDEAAFGFFLSLLGEALAEQAGPDAAVERETGDGLFRVHLQPLAADSRASIRTAAGTFSGRDHLITITPT